MFARLCAKENLKVVRLVLTFAPKSQTPAHCEAEKQRILF